MNVTALSEIEQARFNMVEQQIRPWDVLDFRVLQALFEVQRERYVPAPMQGMAFSDVELPLIINAVDTRETMLTPKVEARLAQRPEEHTSELQSLMRISYAVFCVNKKTHTQSTSRHKQT